jgi:hypothetical protein
MKPAIPPPPPPPKPTQPSLPKQFGIVRGITRDGWKVGIYGPEGIGKSSLAALCPGATFADIEHSMDDFDVPKVTGIEKWEDLRAWVQSLTKCIVGIDSITRAEDWAAEFVIRTKKSNEGLKASDSLEDFKWKAGLTFVVDEFRKLLADIDAARKRGVSFIMVAHARVNRFRNPDGSDYIRYEPRLVDDPKASNMLQWVQFLDHLLFINLDTTVEKGGKVKGGASRTIYLDTSPSRLSKARGIPNDPIIYTQNDPAFWKLLGL